jgi:hypothetical protein
VCIHTHTITCMDVHIHTYRQICHTYIYTITYVIYEYTHTAEGWASGTNHEEGDAAVRGHVSETPSEEHSSSSGSVELLASEVLVHTTYM